MQLGELLEEGGMDRLQGLCLQDLEELRPLQHQFHKLGQLRALQVLLLLPLLQGLLPLQLVGLLKVQVKI
jgi:hypothetical protein